jgi:hypothetical protein
MPGCNSTTTSGCPASPNPLTAAHGTGGGGGGDAGGGGGGGNGGGAGGSAR